jgi:pimeloyl-ACP methyl ester carboxylesterase
MRKSIRALISIAAYSSFSIADLSSLAAQDVGWIDPTTAAAVLPYASMAQNAYGDAALDVQGWEKVSDWRAIFESAGRRDVKAIASSGFSASIYAKKDATGKIVEVAVAYRGTDLKSVADWRTNLQAWNGQTPAQYRYAAELAALVQRQYASVKRITLTGHSLAGATATYAAQQNPKIPFNVVAFSPARVGIVSSVMPRGTSITNVIVPGEMVADENTKSPAGFVGLPGKIYSVRSTTDTAVPPRVTLDPVANTVGIIRELVNPHSMEGTLGGLRAAATEPARPRLQQAPSNPLSEQLTRSGFEQSGAKNGMNPAVPGASLTPRLPTAPVMPSAVAAVSTGTTTSSSTSVPMISTSTQSVTPSATGAMTIGGGWAVRETKPNDERQWFLNGKYAGTEFLGPGGSINRSGSTVSEAEIRNAPAIAGQPGVQYVGGVLPTSNDFLKLSITPSAVASSTGTLKPQTMPSATSGSVPANAQSPVSPIAQRPQPNTQVAARAPAPSASVSSPSVSSGPLATASGIRPAGGISLSRAAADRMPLEIALDASALSDGKIVLSGRASKTRMDAALFLTALRASCDDRDPYFSLDPDNGALWSQQGDQASDEFWERIKKDFPSSTPARAKNALPGVNIRTVSATQDYPGIWHDIAPHYPNFRAKLVFYPEWLRQTRLGEVLYKADVLLKELSSGVSILVPGKLRASAIAGYLSADVEYAAKGLLAGTRDQLAVRPQWRGSRLWFEIAPSESPTTIMNEVTAPPSSDNPALRSLLQSKGLIRSDDQSVRNASFFMRHGSVFDLSQVNPIMFVRVHDHATNTDLSDHDSRLDGLATDVSTRFDQYAQYYHELGLLREVIRAYIAARKITEANDRLCGTLDAMPLLDSEKLTARLPDYHPSELFVTIASYSTVSRKGSQTQFVKASSMSGGVSIAGQKFAETAMRDGETTVTRAVEAALAGANLDQLDAIDSDRKFISFIVDDGSGAPVRLASNARDPPALRSLSDYPIENEPSAAASPFARQNNQGRNGAEWEKSPIGVFLALLTLGLLVSYIARKRRPARS